MEANDLSKQQYYTILLHKLYLDYDTKKDMYVQMIQRRKELDCIKERIKKL